MQTGESVDVYVTKLEALLLKRREKGDLGVISPLNLHPPPRPQSHTNSNRDSPVPRRLPGIGNHPLCTTHQTLNVQETYAVLKRSTLRRYRDKPATETNPRRPTHPHQRIHRENQNNANVGPLVTLPPGMKKS